ncbi:MAG TPA: glycosyltransferase family 39 protein [Geminicoccus sp.]|jgi:4-amino-4-deoxy-L-arabinose transferase-like glycosyltransferase|uniref:ArnT family glycosyltransferase n=1 Tax=Geminicoccus sp. TaxID=2024832 RepID=UPI002E377D66|nr:glycosyltransferase family 39 protein [Geminicoccus sp.]HEX2525888.1 glycosyltransferase family 39 protein [Geminicoccus sp.]
MNSLRQGPLLPFLLFVGAAALYAINLNKAPDFDELYHILAARGYLQTGDFVIAEGVYRRGGPFTWTIAQLFGMFGEDRWVARLPSLISVALMVPLLFVWVRREVGNVAGVLAALLFAVAPFTVDIAQFARFYGIHGLAFLVGCFAVYAAVAGDHTRNARIVLGLVAILSLAIATFFQVTTLIGVAGLGLWAVLYLFGPWFLRKDVPAGRKIGLIVAGLLLLVLALVVAQATGKLDVALRMYRATPQWSAENAGNVVYYHTWFLLFYPTLWTLLPVLLAVALVAAPRPTFFAAVLFGLGIALHSFAGNKSMRYVFYVLPFLYIIWGIALAALIRRVVSFTRAHAGIAFARLAPGRSAGTAATIFLVLAVLWVVGANAAFVRTVTLLADITVPPAQPAPRWAEVLPILRPDLEKADVVLTSNELDSLYFLGRYDILISRSRMGEVRTQGRGKEEFTLDIRTERPVVATPDAVDKIIDCFPTGLLVTPTFRWRNQPMIDDSVADLVVRRMEPIDLPDGSRIKAFRWSHPPTGRQDCPVLPHR